MHADILIAEDDPDDRLILEDAFSESWKNLRCSFVSNGVELIDTLRAIVPLGLVNLPKIILLDLNMPKMDGREALGILKNDPILKKIPTLILTTSANPSDIELSYSLGANSYLTKPSNFSDILEITHSIKHYWIDTVKLPNEKGAV